MRLLVDLLDHALRRGRRGPGGLWAAVRVGSFDVRAFQVGSGPAADGSVVVWISAWRRARFPRQAVLVLSERRQDVADFIAGYPRSDSAERTFP